MRIALIFASLVLATAVGAKERAPFITGQYATAEQCKKLRAIEKGAPENVETSPELLDADGFRSWEGGCSFTKVFEHEPGTSWLAFMICSEGMTMTAASYVFVKDGDTIEMYGAEQADGPEVYSPCGANKGN